MTPSEFSTFVTLATQQGLLNSHGFITVAGRAALHASSQAPCVKARPSTLRNLLRPTAATYNVTCPHCGSAGYIVGRGKWICRTCKHDVLWRASTPTRTTGTTRRTRPATMSILDALTTARMTGAPQCQKDA